MGRIRGEEFQGTAITGCQTGRDEFQVVTVYPTAAINRITAKAKQQARNVVWGKPGTQSQHENSEIQTVTARDRQRSRESRISGARRGQSNSAIKEQ